MPTAALSPPARAPAGPTLTGRTARRGGGGTRRRRGIDAISITLGVLLALTLLLRLWGIKQGLPYSYNSDEASHFVPRAIAFFAHDLDPRYFLNPPAYSYLLHAVFELWYGSGDATARAFARDPTGVFIVARVVAAVMGTAAVWLTYLAAVRLFERVVALLAAAIFAFAFLPVFYSHLALNDVPALAPVALSLLGIAGVLRDGRARDYALAGAGVGLAAATKYTGGFTLVCLLFAAGTDCLRPGRRRGAAQGLALALPLAAVAFVAANPYAILRPDEFLSGLSSQASLAGGADPVKLGSSLGSGVLYYVWTFTWGLGWGPALGALGGAVLLGLRRRFALLSVLVPAPVAFILFMGSEQRFFGRWLMPVFPIVVILAAYAGVETARLLTRRMSVPAVASGALIAVLLLTQSLASDIHDDLVLSRPDTRTLTRAWMVANVPPGAKVVIEPVVPDNWASDVGVSLPWTDTGERWWRYPTWVSSVDDQGNPLPGGQTRFVAVDEYERTLRPELLDEYATKGYCWIVVGSLQAGRAFAHPDAAPQAIAYYAALAARATLAYHVSPFARGASHIPFSFDWSIDYLPRQYRLPGPEMSVYHLSTGKCG